MEALARADVPTVLGYRWAVPDASASYLAQKFYQTLWRTFSPGEALLEARRDAAIRARGRDNDAWASPILLMQNI
jgi:CHAT domain-containing protein